MECGVVWFGVVQRVDQPLSTLKVAHVWRGSMGSLVERIMAGSVVDWSFVLWLDEWLTVER